MALKVKDDEDEESSDDEQTKFKAFITRQFKKFIKNVNVKMNEKGRRKLGFSSRKSLDKPKKETKEGGQNRNTPSGPKCFSFQGYGHMK